MGDELQVAMGRVLAALREKPLVLTTSRYTMAVSASYRLGEGIGPDGDAAKLSLARNMADILARQIAGDQARLAELRAAIAAADTGPAPGRSE